MKENKESKGERKHERRGEFFQDQLSERSE